MEGKNDENVFSTPVSDSSTSSDSGDDVNPENERLLYRRIIRLFNKMEKNLADDDDNDAANTFVVSSTNIELIVLFVDGFTKLLELSSRNKTLKDLLTLLLPAEFIPTEVPKYEESKILSRSNTQIVKYEESKLLGSKSTEIAEYEESKILSNSDSPSNRFVFLCNVCDDPITYFNNDAMFSWDMHVQTPHHKEVKSRLNEVDKADMDDAGSSGDIFAISPRDTNTGNAGRDDIIPKIVANEIPPKRYTNKTPPKPPKSYAYKTPPKIYTPKSPPKIFTPKSPPKIYIPKSPPKMYTHISPYKSCTDKTPPKGYRDKTSPKSYVDKTSPKSCTDKTPPKSYTPTSPPPPYRPSSTSYFKPQAEYCSTLVEHLGAARTFATDTVTSPADNLYSVHDPNTDEYGIIMRGRIKYCTLCNIELPTYQQFDKHVNGIGHKFEFQKRLIKSKIQPPLSPDKGNELLAITTSADYGRGTITMKNGVEFCTLCSVYLPSRSQLRGHLRSFNHRHRYNEMENKYSAKNKSSYEIEFSNEYVISNEYRISNENPNSNNDDLFPNKHVFWSDTYPSSGEEAPAMMKGLMIRNGRMFCTYCNEPVGTNNISAHVSSFNHRRKIENEPSLWCAELGRTSGEINTDSLFYYTAAGEAKLRKIGKSPDVDMYEFGIEFHDNDYITCNLCGVKSYSLTHIHDFFHKLSVDQHVEMMKLQIPNDIFESYATNRDIVNYMVGNGYIIKNGEMKCILCKISFNIRLFDMQFHKCLPGHKTNSDSQTILRNWISNPPI